MKKTPRFYDCSICGGIHPWNFDGDCRDDRNRLSPGDLPMEPEVLSMKDRIKRGVVVSLILASLSSPCIAQEKRDLTVYDKDWQVKERVKDDAIYDKDYQKKGYIKDNTIYDKNWNRQGTVKKEER